MRALIPHTDDSVRKVGRNERTAKRTNRGYCRLPVLVRCPPNFAYFKAQARTGHLQVGPHPLGVHFRHGCNHSQLRFVDTKQPPLFLSSGESRLRVASWNSPVSGGQLTTSSASSPGSLELKRQRSGARGDPAQNRICLRVCWQRKCQTRKRF